MNVKELEKARLHLYDVRRQLSSFVYRRSREAFRRGDRMRDELKNPEELKRRQLYIKERFMQAIGGLPEAISDLKPVISSSIDHESFRIENISFESRPNVKVTCNLYVPLKAKKPCPAVLFLCGHHDAAKTTEEYQRVCQILAQSGLAVLAMDPPGQGERLQYPSRLTGRSLIGAGVREHDYAGSQCLPIGDSLARYFLHDAMRAIDYLEQRSEVDSSRIGVTGNSGGGTQTAMLMMADNRIAAAAPCTFIMSRESFLYAGIPQDAEQIWPGFTLDGLDHEDILISMVPRPVLVLAAAYDFFPIEGTRSAVERTRRFWEMSGELDGLELFVDAVTHKYSERMAHKAAGFFAHHFLGKKGLIDWPVRLHKPESLHCCPGGQALLEASENETAMTLHKEIRQRASEILQAGDEQRQEDRKTAAIEWLRHAVCGGRLPCELHPRLDMTRGNVCEMEVYSAMWRSQRNLFNHAFLIRAAKLAEERLPITIAVWEEGTNRLQEHWHWIRETCAAGRCVMVLDVSGSGKLAPYAFGEGDPLDFYEAIHKLSTDLFWLGDSLAALRTYDVWRAFEAIKQLPFVNPDAVSLYANGREGMYAYLASALTDRVQSMRWEKPLHSTSEWVMSEHYDARNIMGIILPGHLRYFDLPELRNWGCVPVEL
ncbi:acetylxylan esterase [Paenibacillus sp. HB172176]|uniref:acetylxylan esterase n=1 Tax=Paenibacillus sp. HB172176 TaxID=2493690 RepID=UPI00143A1B7E|nr:acetylxylan esterase [Paenibacillus sp. HB172176]